jgi:predicted RNase H-like HicB family nuclease
MIYIIFDVLSSASVLTAANEDKQKKCFLKAIRSSLTYNGVSPILTSQKWRQTMNYHIEYEREEDGRWIAEVPQLPGVLAYGTTANEAMTKAEALALRVLNDINHP